MNLLRQLRPFFDTSVRSRGDRYNAENRVELESVEPGAVYARVEGTGRSYYDIALRWEDEDPLFVLATCTCPHYGKGEFCKHLWATLRIFENGLWGLERDERQVVLHHQYDLDDETEVRGPPLRYSYQRGPAGAPENGAATGHWTQVLERAGLSALDPPAAIAALQSAEPGRQMWLLVDVDASRQHGTLVVDHYFRQRKRNGELGKVRREGVARTDLARYFDPNDRKLLGLIIGNEPLSAMGGGWPYPPYAPQREVSRLIATDLHDMLLPALAQTGRLVWCDTVLEGNRAPDLSSLHSFAWDGGPAFEFHLELTPTAHGATMHGWLNRDDERTPLDHVLAALSDGLVLFKNRIARLSNPNDAPWVNALAQTTLQSIPADELGDFLQHWWSLPYRPAASLPQELELTTVQVEPTGCLAVGARSENSYLFSQERRLTVTFEYAGRRVEFDSPRGAVLDIDRRIAIERDPGAEQVLLDQLREQGIKLRQGYYEASPWHTISERRVEAVTLALLDQGWRVQLDGAEVRQSSSFEIEVRSGIDWFDLEARVDFGGQRVDLPLLLAAREAGRNHVSLADGSIGLLPEAWLDEYENLRAFGSVKDGRLRMKQHQASIVDVLLLDSERSRIEVDEQFARWRDRLSQVTGVEPVDPAPGFAGELRPYQRVGLGWLRFLDDLGVGGCLADDMGLGKTVQIIALLWQYVARCGENYETPLPSIVVVPRSLVFNWVAELERFTPGLRVLQHGGPGRRRNLGLLAQYHVVVTTYGTLRRDIAALSEEKFQYAILDEAQAIKNPKSQAAKACRVLDSKQRLAVTGTPVENHLGELWSLFEFLNPGLLGSAKAFGQVTRGAMGRSSMEAAELLSQGLRPFILRRTKEEVLQDLPAKTEQTLYCELEDDQRRRYDELRDFYRRQLDERIGKIGLGRAKIHVLEALLRLRQAACHPGLVSEEFAGEGSAKLALLLERLQDVCEEGHKALVFSQFTSLLALVRKALDAKGVQYTYLDGRTRNRQRRVARFQDDPECTLFLISLKAGGHGLNLTAADYVFILDPWWNPAVEAQAIDRAHRLGQTRPVFAYRLIARDTVEEKIVQLQARKRKLADAIVAADESLVRNLSADDLALLLS